MDAHPETGGPRHRGRRARPAVHRAARAAAAGFLAGLLMGLAGGPAGEPAAPLRGVFAPPDQPPHYLSDRLFHLRHVRLDLAFDLPQRRIAGTATNTLSPLQPGLDHLVFHAAGLRIARIHLAGSAADLAFTADDVAQTLTVQLPHAYGPQDTLEVAIDYSAQPRAGLFVTGPDRAYPDQPWQLFSDGEPQLNRFWFPSWDEPDDRATSEVLATVDRPLEVIGNGRLVEVADRPDGRRTFHWRMDQPSCTYLISVVIGEWSRRADSWHGVPIESFVPPRLADRAERAFGHTADMMDFLSGATGVPYPFAKYSQAAVYDFMWDGMENISAATETIDTLRDARAALDATSDDLVVHELAHQWFGDYVTARGWDQIWLTEGMATYFEALYRRHQSAGAPTADDELAWRLDASRASYLLEDREKYRRPLVTTRYVEPTRMFDAHTYDKGALVIHMLHDLVGDSAWAQGLHLYLTRHALGTVTSADLEAAFEEVSGVDLQPFFDQFVHGAGYPELKLRWDYQAAAGVVRLTVRQTQDLEVATGLFSFPVDIALIDEAGAVTLRRVPMQALASQDLYLPCGRRPRTVAFDPRGVLLATLDFDKPTAEWIEQLRAPLPLAAHLQALRALANRGGDDAVAALGEALAHQPFRGAREVAAAALAAIGTDTALAALRPATAEPDPRVRATVFADLGAFPDHPELITLLAQALAADPSYGVRAAAAAALGRFVNHRDRAVPPLLAALSQKSFLDEVPGAAIRSLADLDADETFDQALRLVRYGSPRAGRVEAMLALGRYAAHASATRRRTARHVLEELLDDPVFAVRQKAADALADLGDAAAIPALERSLRVQVQDEQIRPREEALKALRQPPAAKPDTAAPGMEDRVRQLERSNEVLEERLKQLQQDRPSPP